jgi:S1-C subfamily serine protease
MSFSDWKVPSAQQPKADEYDFDLERALSSVLLISSVVPETAFSAATLGTERAGNAVLIGEDGLVLTIGYLVNEANSIWLRSNDGKVLPGDVIGIDNSTGFALVRALGRFNLPALPLGNSDTALIGEEVVVAGGGGRKRSVAAHVAARQQFAGYWEYLVENAIFSSPAHPNWGGTAVIDDKGELVGIGSLQIEQSKGKGQAENINMSVPINLFKAAMNDMLSMGQPKGPPRPWLGVYATENQNKVVLMGIADRGPAKKADLRTGDIVLSVAGGPVVDLSSFYKRLWALGAAGVEAPLTVVRYGRKLDVTVKTADRGRMANSPRLH